MEIRFFKYFILYIHTYIEHIEWISPSDRNDDNDALPEQILDEKWPVIN